MRATVRSAVRPLSANSASSAASDRGSAPAVPHFISRKGDDLTAADGLNCNRQLRRSIALARSMVIRVMKSA